MGSLFTHHTETLDTVRSMIDSMGSTLSGSEADRKAHMKEIVAMLDQHKKEVLQSVEDSVADFGKQPMEVRMFMPGEIARSKRPAAVEPAPKRPLENLMSQSNER